MDLSENSTIDYRSPDPQSSAAFPAVPPLTGAQRMARYTEIAVVFFLSPLLFYFDIVPVRFIMVGLLVGAIWALLLIRGAEPSYEQLGLGATGRANLRPVLMVGISLFFVGLVLEAVVRRMNQMPLAPGIGDHLLIWAIFPLIYSASASAQELLFRTFFFWRYKGLLPVGALFVINVLSFGWIHIVFGSWVSVMLSMAGGIIFAGLFLWRKSLLGVIIVHTLFGLGAFATGLGHYFYHGHRF